MKQYHTDFDSKYLLMQFKLKVHSKEGYEFQTFFSSIMQYAYDDFEKIRPYGRRGDGGNDGYRHNEGIYYQVYAPINSVEKEKEAIEKLIDDFNKAKSNWSLISEIKEFYFVFNDKYKGSSIIIEEGIKKLNIENSPIHFKTLFPIKLEEIFLKLPKERIALLEFDLDASNSLKIVRSQLNQLEKEIDRMNIEFVKQSIEIIRDTVYSLKAEGLQLDFEIMECRTLTLTEFTLEAIEKFSSITVRYPKDIRAFLFLAETYNSLNDTANFNLMLTKAREIDSENWHYRILNLMTDYFKKSKLDVSSFEDYVSQLNNKNKSSFYRWFSLFAERDGDIEQADSYIEKAISLYPGRFFNHEAKLEIFAIRIMKSNPYKVDETLVENFYLIKKYIESNFKDTLTQSPRINALIQYRELQIKIHLNRIDGITKLSKEIVKNILCCFYDSMVDQILSDIMRSFDLPSDEFDNIISYILKCNTTISVMLSKSLILQFVFKDVLSSIGKEFFGKVNCKFALTLIDAIDTEESEEVMTILKDDLLFVVSLINFLKKYPNIRQYLIEHLPDDKRINKEKLLLLFNYEQGDLNKAFDIVKRIDLTNITYSDCLPIFKVARDKEAWELLITIINRILEFESNRIEILNYNLELFHANLKLDRSHKTVEIGIEILNNQNYIELLSDINFEYFLGNTLISYLKIGKNDDALNLLDKFRSKPKSYNFSIGIEVEALIKSNNPQRAFDTIVEAFTILGKPSQDDFARLYVHFLSIANMMNVEIKSNNMVEDNYFIKLSGADRWYYIGDSTELDATKITESNQLYQSILGKSLGDNIDIGSKYQKSRQKCTIDMILPIDKYVYYQSMISFKNLIKEGRLQGAQMIDLPQTKDSINVEYLLSFMKEQTQNRQNIMDLYCSQPYPFAVLASNLGGIQQALSIIQKEDKGYINFSSGSLEDIDSQKRVAKRLLDGEAFYLDGLSALLLTETGALNNIYHHISNLKVPQSIINMLYEIADQFRYIPGRMGSMDYARDKLIVYEYKKDEMEVILNRFNTSIKLLLSKPENVIPLSDAFKSDNELEMKTLPELCDASHLSMRDKIPILTEDYLYLKFNSFGMKQQASEYCSFFALISVLYDEKLISFDDYLSYFHYLTTYRFRFLSINVNLIEKSIFGDTKIKVFKPELIRALNFKLTLSENYGVKKYVALNVVWTFLHNMILDDSIVPEMILQIYEEVLSNLPFESEKLKLGRMFLLRSTATLKELRPLIMSKVTNDKIHLLDNVYNLIK